MANLFSVKDRVVVITGKCIILAKSDNITANFITIFAAK
jgi:hypothetical protein